VGPSRNRVVVATLTLVGVMSFVPVACAGAQTPSTQILVPSGGATVSGTKVVLDASASSGVTQVQFEVTGGTLNDTVIAAASLTPYGWVAQWNSTTVTDGVYTLQSIATSGDSIASSSGLSITVQNGTPSVSVVLPSLGASVTGTQWLDATASPGVVEVDFSVRAETSPFSPPMLFGCISPNSCVSSLGHAVPTIYGWLLNWNTADFPAGKYSLFAIAKYANGAQGLTTPLVTVANQAPTLVLPSNGATISGSQWLDCSIPPGTTAPQFWSDQGNSQQVLGSGFPTAYGWLLDWNTAGVNPGTYVLFCGANYPSAGAIGIGRTITVTVEASS
jgi:hypothetical protein